MGLREQMAVDAKAILGDTSGFAEPLTLTSPAGDTRELTGFATDVAESVDPETGVIVSARRASVAISLLTLDELSAELPAVVPDADRKPWLVSFTSATGVLGTWKVVDVKPDRAIGVVVLTLESYDAGTD